MMRNPWCAGTESREQLPPLLLHMSPGCTSPDSPSQGSTSISTPSSPALDTRGQAVNGNALPPSSITSTTPGTTAHDEPYKHAPTLARFASALTRRKAGSVGDITPSSGPTNEHPTVSAGPTKLTLTESNDHPRSWYNVFGSWKASARSRSRTRHGSATSLPSALVGAPTSSAEEQEDRLNLDDAHRGAQWAHSRPCCSAPALAVGEPNSLRTGLAAATATILAPTASLRRSRSATLKLARSGPTQRSGSRPPPASQNRVAASLTTVLAQQSAGTPIPGASPPSAVTAQQPIAGLGVGPRSCSPGSVHSARTEDVLPDQPRSPLSSPSSPHGARASPSAPKPVRRSARTAGRASMPPLPPLPMTGEHEQAASTLHRPASVDGGAPGHFSFRLRTRHAENGVPATAHALAAAPTHAAPSPPAEQPQRGCSQGRRSTLPRTSWRWSALHADLASAGLTPLRTDSLAQRFVASELPASPTGLEARPYLSYASPLADDAAFHALLEQLRAHYRASFPPATPGNHPSPALPSPPTSPGTIRPFSSLSYDSSQSTTDVHSPHVTAFPGPSTSTQTATRPGGRSIPTSAAGCEDEGAGPTVRAEPGCAPPDDPEPRQDMQSTHPGATGLAHPCRPTARSWAIPMVGHLWSSANGGPEPEALALLARVGQVSGQGSATVDSTRAFTDDAAWRKEVHALFVIRELVLGERSYIRYLAGLLDAVHAVLDRREERGRGRERDRDRDRDRDRVSDRDRTNTLAEGDAPPHLFALATMLPRIIAVSQALLVHVGAHATAAGVGTAFADMEAELESTLVEWSKVVPQVMAGLRGAKSGLSYKKRRRQSVGASPFRIGPVSLRPTSIARIPSNTSTIHMTRHSSRTEPEAEVKELDPEKVNVFLPPLSFQLSGLQPQSPTDEVSPSSTSWSHTDSSGSLTKPMPTPVVGTTGSDSASPGNGDLPWSVKQANSLPALETPAWANKRAPSKDLSPSDIVIMPTQRMIQHSLLLQNLRGSTPVGSDAHTRLGTALDIVRRISSLCDGAIP